MSKEKLIIINALSRGGSNILWNIIQSHPEICSPVYETGQIIYSANPVEQKKLISNFAIKIKRLILTSLFRKHAFYVSVFGRIFNNFMQKRLNKYKLMNLEIDGNKNKTENELYTKEELNNSILCLKSLNKDIFLNDFFNYYYDVYYISLIRDGFAWANGWLRRNKKISETAKMYRKFGNYIINHNQMYNNHMIVKFEELLTNPFLVAERVFKFANAKPQKLEKIRLKSKRVLSDEGMHEIKFGKESNKYWFTKDEIKNIIDPSVNESQKDMLKKDDEIFFRNKNEYILRYFNYI